MQDNFEACFAQTERWEGGWVDNPHDPGGATDRGVTQRSYNGYRAKLKLPPRSVRRMTDDECKDLYRSEYWVGARGDDLPAGLDLCQYDEAVNSGAVQAAKLLQTAVGVRADGVLGLETLNAIHNCADIPDLIKKVCAARLSFWHRLKTWAFFGVGWTRRGIGIEAKALEMFANSHKVRQ